MAVGDVKSGISSIAASAYLDIQPSGSDEWVIHNIYHNSDVSIEFYDGTNSIIFDSVGGAGAYSKFNFHCTNARRIRVKNTSTSSKLIGYDGMQTK